MTTEQSGEGGRSELDTTAAEDTHQEPRIIASEIGKKLTLAEQTATERLGREPTELEIMQEFLDAFTGNGPDDITPNHSTSVREGGSGEA